MNVFDDTPDQLIDMMQSCDIYTANKDGLISLLQDGLNLEGWPILAHWHENLEAMINHDQCSAFYMHRSILFWEKRKASRLKRLRKIMTMFDLDESLADKLFKKIEIVGPAELPKSRKDACPTLMSVSRS